MHMAKLMSSGALETKQEKKGQNPVLLERDGRAKHENQINSTREMDWFHGWCSKLWQRPVGWILSSMHLQNQSEETHAGYAHLHVAALTWATSPTRSSRQKKPEKNDAPEIPQIAVWLRRSHGVGWGRNFFSLWVCHLLRFVIPLNVINDCHSCYENQIFGHAGQPPYSPLTFASPSFHWVIHLLSAVEDVDLLHMLTPKTFLNNLFKPMEKCISGQHFKLGVLQW